MISLGNDNAIGNVFYVAVSILKPLPVGHLDKDVQEKILNEIRSLEGSYIVDNVTIEYKSVSDVTIRGSTGRCFRNGRLSFETL